MVEETNLKKGIAVKVRPYGKSKFDGRLQRKCESSVKTVETGCYLIRDQIMVTMDETERSFILFKQLKTTKIFGGSW